MKASHLKEFLVGQKGVNIGLGSGSRKNQALLPPLGVIEVIHATSQGMNLNNRRGVLSMVSPSEANTMDRPKKRPKQLLS